MAISRKDRIDARRKQRRNRQMIIWGAVAVLVLGVVGILVYNSRPKVGVGTYFQPETAQHIPEGDPVDTPSDPPTSGSHYEVSWPAGFYTEESAEYQDPYHDGHLIHSMEHGYIIFWYNCNLLDAPACDQLKTDIRGAMDDFNGTKLIAFPRETLQSPLVMTSWGYMQTFDTFDADLAEEFVRVNRELAPEPNGM